MAVTMARQRWLHQAARRPILIYGCPVTKGQPQGDAAYAYTLEATFTDGTYKQLSGSITLLR